MEFIYIYIYIYICTYIHTYSPSNPKWWEQGRFYVSLYFSLYSKTFTIPFNAMDLESVMLYLHSSIRLHGISRDNFIAD